MAIFKAKTAKENKREKGIALIFTLIMLSLLLILALSFALDSMFEQKAAYNSASASAANLAAKAELNNVLAFLENGSPNFANSTVYSGGGSDEAHSTDKCDQDMLLQDSSSPAQYNSLLLTDGVINTSNINALCFSASNKEDRISWTYHKDADGKIIGRTAFVVIPQEKIPLSSLISKTVDESGGLATGPEVYNEKRIGKEVSEINVRNAMYPVNAGDAAVTYDITPAMADILNWKIGETGVTSNRAAGKYTGSWPEYDTLFGSTYLDLETKIADANNRSDFENNFENTFSLDVLEDSEAFWVDLDNSGDIDSDAGANVNSPVSTYELYKRFDLTRADWDTDAADDSGFLSYVIMLGSSAPSTPMEKWTPIDSFDDKSDAAYLSSVSKGLPWLALFGYQTDGNVDTTLGATFGTDIAAVTARRYQIAANLKDYSDTDSRPTSDVNPNLWATGSVPTYTGNERTPYINKVGVRVEIDLYRSGTFTTTTTVTTKIKPSVGLINIYGATWPENLKVTISGSVTTEISTDDGENYGDEQVAPFTNSGADCLDFIVADNWAKAHDGHSTFSEGSESSKTRTITSPAATTVAVKVRVTKIQIDKIVLHGTSATDAYDYVKNLNWNPSLTTPATEFIAFPNSDTIGSIVSWFGFEVNDPRQNLNPGDWVVLKPKQHQLASKVLSVTSDATPEGEPNSLNTNIAVSGTIEDPTTGPDPETETDSANCALSTAYIRNAPMESPWELGFIHRGAKWETLNLKKYDSSKAKCFIPIGSNKYIPGGGAYANGDANILDQIKMTKKAATPEKVNIRSQEDRILNALFSQVNLGCNIVRDNTNFPLVPASHMTVDSMTTSGTTVIDPYDSMAAYYTNYAAMLSGMKAVSGLTRAAYADKLKDFTATLGSTDAAQEELIGKIINLTKINQKPGGGNYSIIVISQTIKDVGITSPGTIDVYKTPADGSAAQKVECQLGRFDISGTDDNWKKNAYGDDIIATQKILVKTSKINNKTKITSFKYID